MRYVIYLVVAASLYLFVQSSLEEREARNVRRAELKKLTQEQIEAVEDYISAHSVNSTWMNSICGENRNRIGRIRSIELETAWQSDQLVMFPGNFGDISTSGAESYTVEVEQGLWNSNRSIAESFFDCMLIGTELRLELISDGHLIDPYLDELKENNTNFGLENTHVFIAKISRIEPFSELVSELDTVDGLKGYGTLHQVFPITAGIPGF
jgi:hypothetical protein